MVTWALVLETIVKWLIPVVCAGLLAVFIAHLVKPFKAGTQVQQQQTWDANLLASTVAQEQLNGLEKKIVNASKEEDEKILKEIKTLGQQMATQQKEMKQFHDSVDKSIDLIQQGVRDAHLQNLINTCQIFIRRGYITPAEFETYQARYNLYKELGGNGHMEPWNAKVCALPNEPPKPPTFTGEERRNNNILPIPKTHV